MSVGVINALFQSGISPNNDFIILLCAIVFVSTSILLFFKFTSTKDKETELNYYNYYEEKELSKDFVVVELLTVLNMKSINYIDFINIFYYEGNEFKKVVISPRNKFNMKVFEDETKDKVIVFKDYATWQLFKLICKVDNPIILTAEHYKKTLKYVPFKDLITNSLKGEKMKIYIENNYNKYIVKQFSRSEVCSIVGYYLSLQGGN